MNGSVDPVAVKKWIKKWNQKYQTAKAVWLKLKGKIELKIDSFGFSTNIKNYNELVQIIEKLNGPIKNYATPSGLKRAWIV